jgi:hypothetical protein
MPAQVLLVPTQGIAAALVAGLTATIVATAPAPALTASAFAPPAHAYTPTAAVVVVPAVLHGAEVDRRHAEQGIAQPATATKDADGDAKGRMTPRRLATQVDRAAR